MAIEPGLTGEYFATVLDSDTAHATGGEQFPPVLSTPRVIGWMEHAAAQAVAGELQPGQTTVGALVNIRHMAPTPVGMRVRVLAELLEVDRRRLRFHVIAQDEKEVVAEGEHERFIIDLERFLDRVKQKQSAA